MLPLPPNLGSLLVFWLPIVLVLMGHADAFSWGDWNNRSSQQQFANITSIPSNVDAMTASVVKYHEADCDSIVLAWLHNNRINYRIFYCFFKYGHFSSSEGFTPFWSLREEEHSFPISVPGDYPNARGSPLVGVSNRPDSWSIAVAQDSNGLVFSVNRCYSRATVLYSGQACNKDFQVGSNVIQCRNDSFDLDRDVHGRCRYRVYRGIKLHEPANGLPTVTANSLRAVQHYRYDDIPEHDESPRHADPTLWQVPNMVGSFSAMKDLDGDDVPEVVTGGVYRRPVSLWSYRSNIERPCCENSQEIDSGASDPADIFQDWRMIEVPNSLSGSISDVSSGWVIRNNRRILPDGNWRRPARGWLDPSPEAYSSTEVDIEFEWGIDEDNYGAFNHGEAGFLFGVSDDSNYYVYVMSNHRLCGNLREDYAEGVLKATSGSRSILRTRGNFPQFYPGQKHDFRITLKGTRIRVWRDGVQIFNFVDSGTIHSGSYGFYVWAYFDKIVINTRSVSGDVQVNSDYNNPASSTRECVLRTIVSSFTSNTYASAAIRRATNTIIPGCGSSNGPLSCTASWVNLDIDSRPDLLVHCTVGTSDFYKVGYNWGLSGPVSWGDFSRGSINHSNSNTKLALLDVPFNDRSPTAISIPNQVPPVMMITAVNGALRYRHMMR
ncbi:hypothetical protein P9112_005311 [Eukaryota sp. TZLM1-RC]